MFNKYNIITILVCRPLAALSPTLSVTAVGTLDKPRLKHKRCLCLLSVTLLAAVNFYQNGTSL